MSKTRSILSSLLLLGAVSVAQADFTLLKDHCSKCHNADKQKGDFELALLGQKATEENLDYWLDSLDYVKAGEMPPEDKSELSEVDRQKLISFLESQVHSTKKTETKAEKKKGSAARRLNNREFAHSIRDVLFLEDIGTSYPTANLIADTRHEGFDTHGASLGFSHFHLEQYIKSARKIVDATIFSTPRPESKHYLIPAERIQRQSLRQNTRKRGDKGKNGSFEFLDPRLGAEFLDFKTAPYTGYYTFKIKCTGKDRQVYDTSKTGFYKNDAIQLAVHMGSRQRLFDLPDEEPTVLELREWITEGTPVELRNPTDAFRLQGNGNFKFQYRISAMHHKKYRPAEYKKITAGIRAKKIGHHPKGRKRKLGVDAWQHWQTFWEGARPVIYSVEIEGPHYDSWPPKRQQRLLGEDPTVADARKILTPIAERAWRRPVKDGELDDIIRLVQEHATRSNNDIEALKEGIVALFVTPSFIFLNADDGEPVAQLAAKLSYFFQSTTPSPELQKAVYQGQWEDFKSTRQWVHHLFKESQAEDFLTEFPYAWLELNKINFMAPDPAKYRFYHRKSISEDMIEEVRQFFRHAVANNIPIPEFLTADYSFINRDLAEIYQVKGIPEDSKFRKHTFADGRRGGLLGMGAFLTSTADSLSTSPIHRAVYVMEKFMGIHPKPPPPDVPITEPDVRQARTIKEILAAHASQVNCASCHETIDPWGYAFENFNPIGAWREEYVVPDLTVSDDDENPKKKKKRRAKPKTQSIAIDASAKFRNGIAYQNIIDFRQKALTAANQERFVRRFIERLLLYANGVEPTASDYLEIQAIMEKAAKFDYRIVDTIAVMIQSPLFRR